MATTNYSTSSAHSAIDNAASENFCCREKALNARASWSFDNTTKVLTVTNNSVVTSTATVPDTFAKMLVKVEDKVNGFFKNSSTASATGVVTIDLDLSVAAAPPIPASPSLDLSNGFIITVTQVTTKGETKTSTFDVDVALASNTGVLNF